MRSLAKRRINESMSSRLLRTARPDNDLAARTRRIHDRMGAPPYWRNNDNVEVRPEIHDHSVETRRDSAVHPTQGRRYVQVKETGWKEIVPPDMPFDVNRLHEPLVSMSRFWPNVQPDQPPLKFAAWFQKILEYMKYMTSRNERSVRHSMVVSIPRGMAPRVCDRVCKLVGRAKSLASANIANQRSDAGRGAQRME